MNRPEKRGPSPIERAPIFTLPLQKTFTKEGPGEGAEEALSSGSG